MRSRERSSGRESFLFSPVFSSAFSTSPRRTVSSSISAAHFLSLTVKMKISRPTSMIAATAMIYTVYFIYGCPEVLKTLPRTSTRIPPTVPTRFMIAFALERKGFTVTSGISATAGERKVAIATRTTRRIPMKATITHILFKVIFRTSC